VAVLLIITSITRKSQFRQGDRGSGPAMTAEKEKQAAVVSLPVFLLKKIRANL
jgi:hypothetical protein